MKQMIVIVIAGAPIREDIRMGINGIQKLLFKQPHNRNARKRL